MTGVIQTWDPIYGLSTQKQPIFFINVPKTVRKGSCVYGLNRPYASRHCERPRGLVGTILVSTDIYKTLFTRWCVYFKLDMDLKYRDFSWEIFEIGFEISRDQTTQAEG